METERPEQDSLNPAIIALIVAVGAISINAPIVGAEGIETSFGLNRGAAAMILGSFAIGYGIGHLVIGLTAHLLSWRLILIISLTGYIVSGAAVALSSTIEALQYARICQGVFAAAAPILGRAVVRTIQHSGIATKTFTSASALFAWALLAYVTGLLIFLIIRSPHQLKKQAGF